MYAAPRGSSGSAHGPAELRASVGSEATATTAAGGNAARRRGPRSLPPWIDSYETRYGEAPEDQLQLLSPPGRTVQPQHQGTPSEPERRVSKDGFVDWRDPALEGSQRKPKFPTILKRHRPERGRKWDHLRSAEPVIVAGYSGGMGGASASHAGHNPASSAAAWRDFVNSSTYGHMPGEESEVVDVEMLDKLQPTFNKEMTDLPPTLDHKMGGVFSGPGRRRRTLAIYQRVWRAFLHHPFSPLIFRMTVIVTSIMALAIAARIYEFEDGVRNESAERTQAVVAVVVDTVAIPYIGYMIWDEYTGKPLGLRPPSQKIGLILMDLFFIVFKSASTSLAFEALVYHNTEDGQVRQLSKALASFMLVGLISWNMTFVVNVFRTVERLGGGEDEGARM